MNKNISDSTVFLSESVMQICDIPPGDPVLITKNNYTIVKRAWPINDKTLTSAYLTKNGI